MAAPTNYDQTNDWLAEVGRLTQDLINVLKGGIDVGQSGTLGNLALIDSLSTAPIGNPATLRANLGFVAAALTEMQKYGIGVTTLPNTWPLSSLDDNPTNVPSGMYRATSGFTYQATIIWLTYNSGVGSMLLIEIINSKAVVRSRGYGSAGWGAWRRMLDSESTTVDSNGFIKAASPIFRLANSAESATDESHNFTDAGAGAANGEAQGVTATHDAQGVYTITGSLGFATQGWTVEVPQDANGNRLCVVETEQADDGTITVRTFSKCIDPDTGDVVADQPMDIPEGRWIDLRLSMPEPPTNDHPDDAPESPVPLTPEQEEQARIEQLDRWRSDTKASAFQAHQALDDYGLYAQVEALMNDPATPTKTRRAWRMATEFHRLSPTVLELAGVLGLTDEQLDELFRHALTIEA